MVHVMKEKEKLADVPVEYVFWLHDGRVLKNLKDLEQALLDMSDETYNFHVNAEKNDFYNWVKDVAKDDRLARELLRARSRPQAAKRVTERLALLTSGRA